LADEIEERPTESGDLATEGEQNSITTPLEDIVARSKRERDKSLEIEPSVDPEVEEVIDDSGDQETDDLLDVSESKPSESGEGGDSSESDNLLKNEKVDKLEKQASNFIIERDGEQYLLATVGGIQKEVPLGEAQTIIQKNTNADLQTTIAVQKQRHFEDLSRDLQQRQESTRSDDTPVAAMDKEALNGAFKELYEGDYAKGTETVVEVINAAIVGSQTSKLTSADVAHQVDEVLKTRELRSAYTRFSAKPRYQALLADQYLKDRIDQETEKLTRNPFYMDGHPSYDQIFEAAGDAVINWAEKTLGSDLGGKKPDSEPQPAADKPLDKELKAVQKRAHRSSVKAAAARRTVPDELLPRTNSEIIADLAKSRGQNTLS